MAKKNMMLRSDLKQINTSSPAATRQCLTCGFGDIPVSEFTTITGEVPMLDSDIATTFSDDMEILGTSNPGVQTDRSLSFAGGTNATIQTDLLLLGYGLHVTVEPKSFSIHANGFTPAAATTPPTAFGPPASPDVFVDADAANQGPAAGLTAGHLIWGQSAWQAMAHFLKAYRFQWIVNTRDIVVDELLNDVAYVASADGAEGFGTSEIAAMPYFRRVNERLRLLGAPNLALPITHRRYGSMAGGASVFHPTRDFDTAPLSWGSPIAGCCDMPFRKFARPCLIERNVPINIQLVSSNLYHLNEMRRNLSITDNGRGAGTVDSYSPDALMGPSTAGLPELTADTGVPVTTVVQQQRVFFKGGFFEVKLFFVGYELPPVCRRSVLDICDIWAPGQGGILRGDGSVMGLNGQPVGSQVIRQQ